MKAQTRKILITGGAGFVGSRLALLLKRKYPYRKLIAMDNLLRRGSELNIGLLEKGGVRFFHGDTRNAEDFEGLEGVGTLIECSANPSVLAGLKSGASALIRHNLVGTANCLDFAKKNRSDVVFLSTSRVYPIPLLESLRYQENASRFVLSKTQEWPGVSADGISESFPLEGHRSLYGATKLSSEHLVEEYRHFFGLKTVINRCGVIAGPGQMGRVDQGFVALWVAAHFWKRPLDYIGYGGRGRQVRDILHVEDLFRLVDYQLHHMDRVDGQVFNVGGGPSVSVSLSELSEMCQKITGKKLKIGSVPKTRPADVPIYLTDHAKVTRLTGWRPRKGAETVVEDTYRWMRENKTQLEPFFQWK